MGVPVPSPYSAREPAAAEGTNASERGRRGHGDGLAPWPAIATAATARNSARDAMVSLSRPGGVGDSAVSYLVSSLDTTKK